MSYNEKTGNYITPVGRASFPVLVEPKQINGEGEPKFQLTILIDPEGQKHQDFIDLEDAVSKAIAEKWGKNPPRKVKSPFMTTDDLLNKIPAGYGEDDVFIRLSSTIPVGVVKQNPDGSVSRLESAAELRKELYAGCNIKAAVNVYAWSHKVGGAGVSLGLSNVMKVGDNDPFGATNASSEDDFDVDVSGGAQDDFMG